MTKSIVLGTAASLCFAGVASALTMTPISDNRMTTASAMAGLDSDSDSDAPGAGFPAFVSEVSAQASEFGCEDELVDYVFGGTFADANARQNSSVGALSIIGSGSANAGGNHGQVQVQTFGDEGPGYGSGSFSASAQSLVRILFSIDEDAAFDLDGFISAGNELAIGAIGNKVINNVSVNFYNYDTDDDVFTLNVFDDFATIDESGVLAAGRYELEISALAEVFGGAVMARPAIDGDSNDVFGYETRASFDQVVLNLSAIDKPIPEPVTTALVGMSLGALMLGTARRRA